MKSPGFSSSLSRGFSFHFGLGTDSLVKNEFGGPVLKILDYSSWQSIYKSDIESALRLIAPENVNSLDDGYVKIFDDLPWRFAPELRFLFADQDYAKDYLKFSYEDIGIIHNAAPILHERIVYSTSARSESEDLDYKQLDFASFLKMLLITPLTVLTKTVGEASVQINSYHGFTNLQLETVGKSVRAKISHHQNDPTYVYGMPEILSKYAWDCTFDMSKQVSNDKNGFQALYNLPKLNFEEAIQAIVSSFTDALAKSTHNLGKFDEADGRLVRLHLTTHDGEFDRYLEHHNDFTQKFWMHHYLHVKLNERYE